MLVLPPVVYRPRRGRVKDVVKARPAGVALLLVASTYDENVGVLRLQFDRAINPAGLDGAAITVRDGAFNDALYNGVSDVAVIDPATIELTLVAVGEWDSEEVTLTAAADSGIVAVDDGGTWAGATDVALPFP